MDAAAVAVAVGRPQKQQMGTGLIWRAMMWYKQSISEKNLKNFKKEKNQF